MPIVKIAVAFVAALLATGCVSPPMYDWGDYETALFRYYKNPENVDAYMESLSVIVVEAEADGRIPPGLYAEYGYMLSMRGERDQALAYFEREREAWPESSDFIDVLIADASRLGEKDGEAPPADNGLNVQPPLELDADTAIGTEESANQGEAT